MATLLDIFKLGRRRCSLPSVAPEELKQRLDRGEALTILDLRHPLDFLPDPAPMLLALANSATPAAIRGVATHTMGWLQPSGGSSDSQKRCHTSEGGTDGGPAWMVALLRRVASRSTRAMRCGRSGPISTNRLGRGDTQVARPGSSSVWLHLGALGIAFAINKLEHRELCFAWAECRPADGEDIGQVLELDGSLDAEVRACAFGQLVKTSG